MDNRFNPNPNPFQGYPFVRGFTTPTASTSHPTNRPATGATGNAMQYQNPQIDPRLTNTPRLPPISALLSSGPQVEQTPPFRYRDPYAAPYDWNPLFGLDVQGTADYFSQSHSSFNGPDVAQRGGANFTQQQPHHTQTPVTGHKTHLHSHHGPGFWHQRSTSNFNMAQQGGVQQTPSQDVRSEGVQSSAMQPTTAVTKPTEADMVQRIVASLGKPEPQSKNTDALGVTAKKTGIQAPTHALPSVGDGISALSGRGIHVPVKTKAGEKRAAEGDASTVGHEDNGNETNQPKAKGKLREPPKKKTKGQNATNTAAVDDPESDSDVSLTGYEFTTESIGVQLKKIAAFRAAKRAAKSGKGTKAKGNASIIDAIAAGTAIPTTPEDAKCGAEVRHTALLAHARNNNNNTTTTPTPRGVAVKIKPQKSREPDVMPEFFHKANFTKNKTDDTVRCACGATDDDGAEMLACDSCGVWQHSACMGDAVPEDLAGGRYACHMCDPFVHRVLLARLRGQNPL